MKKLNNKMALILIPFTVIYFFWALFAYQRVRVLMENDLSVYKAASSITGIKYILGMSYSAEQMSIIIGTQRAIEDAREALQNL